MGRDQGDRFRHRVANGGRIKVAPGDCFESAGRAHPACKSLMASSASGEATWPQTLPQPVEQHPRRTNPNGRAASALTCPWGEARTAMVKRRRRHVGCGEAEIVGFLCETTTDNWLATGMRRAQGGTAEVHLPPRGVEGGPA